MYPFRFEPIFRRYIWGGNRLRTMLGKQTGEATCAESWEIVDHGEDQSVVSHGPLQGTTLHQLVQDRGVDLLGESWLEKINASHYPANLKGRFPLLLKFLDATKNLSVQVHPDDAMGATLQPPDLGKTEAWYVMHANDGAKIYAGLKDGVTQYDLKNAVSNGTTEDVVHSFEPQAGDCVFIQAGTLHAIGAGLVIAEIQQASNTTFRVFDWNRVDSSGKSRELHIKESLQATNYELGPIHPAQPTTCSDERSKTIVSCDKFVMRRWNTNAPVELANKQLRLLAVTSGNVRVSDDPSNLPLSLADSMIVPAACENVIVTPQGLSLIHI